MILIQTNGRTGVASGLNVITAPSFYSLALLLGFELFSWLSIRRFLRPAWSETPRWNSNVSFTGTCRRHALPLRPGASYSIYGWSLVLGAWLAIFYREHIGERDEQGERNEGIVVLLLNVYAYLLGAVTLALPNWIAVGTTVAAVLLLAGRERLHGLARRVEMKEVVTVAQFLILTGLILPLLPTEPLTGLTSITPRQVWLALVVVCTLSYASYLAQRYWAPAARGLWMAGLGGLYSSTATTVVLARQAKSDASLRRQAQAGITLATGVMYLRILAIVAVFNVALARRLVFPLVGLSLAAVLISTMQYWFLSPSEPQRGPVSQNPLALGAAAIFAILFVLTSLLSAWVKTEFGIAGIYSLAAVIGIADIDPFVLNLAQGGTLVFRLNAMAAAILIAASSNNLLKAVYAASFAGRRAVAPSAAALVVLAFGGIAIAMAVGGL